ncbi:uncharacterized protein METZ01_LOCUS250904, partial [marine metagenome]
TDHAIVSSSIICQITRFRISSGATTTTFRSPASRTVGASSCHTTYKMD